MTLQQLRTLAGGAVIDLRVADMPKALSMPAMILTHATSAADKVLVRWHDIDMPLTRTTWDIVYQQLNSPAKKSITGWRNPNPAMPPILAGLSSIRLLAKGGSGIVTINKTAHKTRYAIPENQLLAHKIIRAQALFSVPVPVNNLVSQYGNHYETVTEKAGGRMLRFWVLEEKDELPLSLHAVDFPLTNDGKEVSGYIVSGTDIDYVQRKFSVYYQQWMDHMRD